MTSELTDANQVAKIIGLPVERWPGNCYSVAALCITKGVVVGRLQFGMWLGHIAKASVFKGRPMARHGWILLPDGRIWDPTRWVFEAAEPYIYVGKADCYDPGMNFLREAKMHPPPPVARIRPFTMRLSNDANEHVADLLKVVGWNGELGKEQLFWLANVPLHLLQPHARAIYREILRFGFGAYIPIDNRQEAGP